MYIGIDLGTSGVKLLLLSKNGEVIKTVSRSYDVIIPKQGWTEQDPKVWYNQTIDALREIVKGNEKSIKAISFSGQMHGMVLLDKKDEIIRNAILWNDHRTKDEVKQLNNDLGVETLLKETGNIALTGLTAPKILWVYNNEPKNFSKIAKIMLPKDYLSYKLSRNFATDVSDVSGTLYYDVKNKKYSNKLLSYLNITKDQLPRVYESYEKVGNLDKKIKELLNIKQDVDIVIGGGDQAVGAVGVGIVTSGKCNISLGTSGVVFTAMENFAVDEKSHLQSYAAANGKYHMMGVTLNAAGALKWWSETVFEKYNYDDMFEKMIKTKIDEELYFLPYLSGERSPVNDINASGAFIGLRDNHTKCHLDRAVIEGISYNLKMIYEVIKSKGVTVDTIRITGGGAKSLIWPQMLADIFNVEIETITSKEGPALGAAILAMVGHGKYPDVNSACNKIIKVKQRYKPNNKNVFIYEKKYNKFKTIYPMIKNF